MLGVMFDRRRDVVGGPLGLSPGVPLVLLFKFSLRSRGPLGCKGVDGAGLDRVLFSLVGEIIGLW